MMDGPAPSLARGPHRAHVVHQLLVLHEAAATEVTGAGVPLNCRLRKSLYIDFGMKKVEFLRFWSFLVDVVCNFAGCAPVEEEERRGGGQRGGGGRGGGGSGAPGRGRPQRGSQALGRVVQEAANSLPS